MTRKDCMFSTDTTAHCGPDYRVYISNNVTFFQIFSICAWLNLDANQWIWRADYNSLLFIYFSKTLILKRHD